MDNVVSVLVSASGEDRPGIVAAVTRVLYELGCNLEDSAMTRLEGAFAMLVIARVDREKLSALEAQFARVGHDLGLSFHVKQMSAAEAVRPVEGGVPFIISLYGADRPGLVYRVAELLAERGVNISDVETHRSEGEGRGPLYQLVLEVELPSGVDSDDLMKRLHALGKEMHVEVTGHAMEMVEL